MSGYDDIDINSAINEFSTDNNAGDVSAGNGSAASAPAPDTNAAPEAEFEYQARGQTIKEPISKILNRASQGYDYAYNNAQLKAEREAYLQERQQFDERAKYYQEVMEYAAQNPQWWEHVNGQFQNRGQQPGQQQFQDPTQAQDPIQQYRQLINEELAPLKQFVNETLAERHKAAAEAADSQLKKEIEETKKLYSFQDFNRIDEHGRSIEAKVLEHAKKIGTNSFKVAYRDLYHEDLMNRAKSEGLQKAAEEKQRLTKLGIIGGSPTPTVDRSKIDYKNLSYDQLAELAMQDPGLLSP